MKQVYSKSLLLLVAALFAQLSFVNAQSLQLLNQPGVTTGDPWFTVEVPIYVKNISANTINVIAYREEQTLAPGHSSYFCWDVCFGPAGTIGAPISVAPGDTIKLFKSYLDAFGSPGTSSIRYSFYNEANMADSLQYTFVYDMGPLGLDELDALVSRPYPNPARSHVSVDLNLPKGAAARVEVINAIGRIMKSYTPDFAEGTVTISTRTMAPGVYFLRTMAGNKAVRVQKFTVL